MWAKLLAANRPVCDIRWNIGKHCRTPYGAQASKCQGGQPRGHTIIQHAEMRISVLIRIVRTKLKL